DYGAVSGTLTFAPNQTVATFAVPVVDDAEIESTEVLELQLSNPVNASLGNPDDATLYILDNDNGPTVQFSASNYSVGEGDGSATITVTLSASSSDVVTVDYYTTDGAASDPDDYAGVADTLTFQPGQTTATFTVAVVDDAEVEGDEDLHLCLTTP